MEKNRETFGRMGYVMALAGSAIGLGNIWRFPYMVGEHGGAAFIILYIICSLVISIPILFCESIIGRRAGLSTFGALRKLAPGSNWSFVGLITVIGCFVILSFYSVVGGWSIDYLVRSVSEGFSYTSIESSSKVFASFSSAVWEPLLFFTLFLMANTAIVLLGIKNGIENFTKVTIPLLFIIIVFLAGYSISLPGAGKGVYYILHPDFSKINGVSVACAMGQSFFSISVGVGCVLTFSSYMSKSDNIVSSGILTGVFDTIFALIAAFAIMPAVFASGVEPGAGPSLIFETLPYIFANLSAQAPVLGRIITIVFFLSILMAALTSSISMLEVVVSNLVDQKHLSRTRATVAVSVSAWVLGALCCLSFGVLSGFTIGGQNLFGMCDILSSNYIMMIGAFFFCLFVGWKMDKSDFRSEFTNDGTVNLKIFGVVRFLIRWVVPVMILLIFLSNFII